VLYHVKTADLYIRDLSLEIRERTFPTDKAILLFQTQIILSNRIHTFNYLRSTTLGCIDNGIKKLEFVAKTQFL